MAGGRPTTYNEQIANLVCERVATHNIGLIRLCKMYDDMPDHSTIKLWRYKHQEFSSQYAQAKMHQSDLLAEECLDIADDCANDWIDSEDGNLKFNCDHFQRARLRIDTRKWLACKLLPKQYGDRMPEQQSPTDNIKDISNRVNAVIDEKEF